MVKETAFHEENLQRHLKLGKPKSDNNDYWRMNLSENRYLKKQTKPPKPHDHKSKQTPKHNGDKVSD